MDINETDELMLVGPQLPDEQARKAIEATEYESATGETMAKTLDIDSWQPGENLAELYSRLEGEMAEAVEQEGRILGRVRNEVFPKLRTRPGAPKNAGVYQASLQH